MNKWVCSLVSCLKSNRKQTNLIKLNHKVEPQQRSVSPPLSRLRVCWLAVWILIKSWCQVRPTGKQETQTLPNLWSCTEQRPSWTDPIRSFFLFGGAKVYRCSSWHLKNFWILSHNCRSSIGDSPTRKKVLSWGLVMSPGETEAEIPTCRPGASVPGCLIRSHCFFFLISLARHQTQFTVGRIKTQALQQLNVKWAFHPSKDSRLWDMIEDKVMDMITST